MDKMDKMDKMALIERLELLNTKSNEEWMNSLDPRKVTELEFHDRHRDENVVKDLSHHDYEAQYSNKKFYRIVRSSGDYLDSWINRRSPGRIFLDYACGNGLQAIKAAKAGADLAIGIDISRVSIENARQRAEASGVADRTYFVQADCENTGLPDESIDLCVCSGMLHHLDLSYSFPELRRILRKGGVILALEALDHNPLIRLYRKMTPQMRTEWETDHILSYSELEFARRFFDVRDLRHWYLFSLIGVYFPRGLKLFEFMDKWLLKVPPFRKMSWMMSFELHK